MVRFFVNKCHLSYIEAQKRSTKIIKQHPPTTYFPSVPADWTSHQVLWSCSFCWVVVRNNLLRAFSLHRSWSKIDLQKDWWKRLRFYNREARCPKNYADGKIKKWNPQEQGINKDTRWWKTMGCEDYSIILQPGTSSSPQFENIAAVECSYVIFKK